MLENPSKHSKHGRGSLLQFLGIVRELRVLKRHARECTCVAATLPLKLYVSFLNNMQRLRCCSLRATPVDAFE